MVRKVNVRHLLLCAGLGAYAVLMTGCTAALWEKETFARHYRPARPTNLCLFYSNQRKDVLVQYDERGDSDVEIRQRCYWLEPNALRIQQERAPHFADAKKTGALETIPLNPGGPQMPPGTNSFKGLCAIPKSEEDAFTLWSGDQELESHKLPLYRGGSQRVKQVLLTPFAVAIDATIVGAAVGYHAAPGLLESLNH